VKPAPFAYTKARTLKEAVALLSKHKDDARLLAGGQSLIATLNMRLSAPELLIDINGIKGLDGIAKKGKFVEIGALARHAQVERSELIAKHAPLIALAMPLIGHPAIRNRGTFGGSIAFADPAAELPACLLALGAEIEIAGHKGKRKVKADAFFKGLFETALRPVPLMTRGKMVPRIGIGWDTTGQMTIAHPNPIEQVYDSVTSTLNTIEAVASPKSDVRLRHLSGPVGIVRIYYLLFESDRGWQLALWFSVILNVNLAILNMLPIPVLDGGHIVLALVEAVRRKPVNIRVLEIVQTGCAVLIIGYIAYVSFFDVGDWLGEKRTDDAPSQAVQASPSP